MRLDTTTRKLQVLLGGTVATSSCTVVVSYRDENRNAPQPLGSVPSGTQVATVSSVTAVDILSAPLVNTVVRIPVSMSVMNPDTVTASTTIRLNDNGTSYPIWTRQLAPNETVFYEENEGWYPVSTVAGASGTSITLGTEQSLANTSVIFTGIPSGVKRLTAMFNRASQTSTQANYFQLQLGTTSGIFTTSYQSAITQVSTGTVTTYVITTGFGIGHFGATGAHSGAISVYLENSVSSTWVANGGWGETNNGFQSFVNGRVILNSELTQIRFTTFNSTATFDSGVMNIQYE